MSKEREGESSNTPISFAALWRTAFGFLALLAALFGLYFQSFQFSSQQSRQMFAPRTLLKQQKR